jgi:hypothetical protein
VSGFDDSGHSVMLEETGGRLLRWALIASVAERMGIDQEAEEVLAAELEARDLVAIGGQVRLRGQPRAVLPCGPRAAQPVPARRQWLRPGDCGPVLAKPCPCARPALISCMVLWNQIGAIVGAKTVTSARFGDAVLLPVRGLDTDVDTFWMIARYKDQTKLATALRDEEEAQEFVTEHHVRFGFRKTDVPPAGVVREEEYGKTIINKKLASKDFSGKRVNPVTKPVNAENATQSNRLSDREENVRLFWRSQTPQSHHIVEFNHLNEIGRSKKGAGHFGPLDHSQLPCVLLAAEFHQRYVSSILKPTHHLGKNELWKAMEQTYWSLYVTGPLRPLWDVSRLILREAGLPVK